MILPPVHILQSFYVFSKEGGVIPSAVKLGLTQPTITRHLNEIQRYFDLDLFEYRGRRKVLTSFGLRLAKKLGEKFEDLDKDLHEFLLEEDLGGDTEAIQIGGRAELFKRLLKVRPCPFNLKIEYMDSLQSATKIRKSEIDIVLTQALVDSAQYVRKKLFFDKMGFVFPAAQSTPSLEKNLKIFRDFPFAMHTSLGGGALEKAMRQVNVDWFPKIKFEVADWDLIEAIVSKGNYWSWMPSSFVNDKASYRFMSSVEDEGTQFWAYFKKNKNARAVVDWLLETSV